MGITERQARERKLRIEMILDAATKVIADKGIDGATMEEIAATAELGKATIYNYFPSKQALLVGLDLRGTKAEEAGFRRAYEDGKNGLDRTLGIMRFYFNYATDQPVCFQAKVHMGRIDALSFAELKSDAMMDQYMQALRRISRILADAIADGVRDTSIRSDVDPQRWSLLLWCQSNGVLEIIQNRRELISTVLGVTTQQVIDDFFLAIERQLVPGDRQPGAATP